MTDETDNEHEKEADAQERAEFYDRISVAVNREAEEEGTAFINPVQVQEMFADMTGLASWEAQQAEVYTRRIDVIDDKRAELVAVVGKLRRTIIARNFGKIRSGWSAEVLDAFIVANATPDETKLLEDLEGKIEICDTKLRRLKSRQRKHQARIKRLDSNAELAKEYLNYEKHDERIRALIKAGKL